MEYIVRMSYENKLRQEASTFRNFVVENTPNCPFVVLHACYRCYLPELSSNTLLPYLLDPEYPTVFQFDDPKHEQ